MAHWVYKLLCSGPDFFFFFLKWSVIAPKYWYLSGYPCVLHVFMVTLGIYFECAIFNVLSMISAKMEDERAIWPFLLNPNTVQKVVVVKRLYMEM